MPTRTVRVRARQAAVPPIRLETFGEEPVGVAFPPGTTGLTKVTSHHTDGPGRYLGVDTPPTSESAARRLVLPASNQAEELRIYRTTGWLYASIGTVAGSRTNELQVEVHNPEVLQEVSRWSLPLDFEARLSHVLAGVAAGALAGLMVGYAIGNPLMGLIFGAAAGLILGFLAPTDWKDLLSLFVGAPQVSLLLTLA
jgi:hypothetical protein